MKRFTYLLVAAVAVAISGCALRQSQARASDSANAQVGIANYTGNYIYSASVDGAGGGNMASWGVGIANICCTSIPRVWHPGMKVLVRWDMPVGHQHIVKEKVVEVEKYERPGDIYLVFLPNDEVHVVVSRDGPGAPDFPAYGNNNN
ncbi:DUF3304 domain-containing protein [Duganella vulcania]|uniref:DUF3304 domain-containing protein n=1 Tax=Duganella vulcania TaxID=2692166 RepID=A0A845GT29_9BURK|nr:DUF3304 domain-containing protein [Duganella vulcania]MYM95827.1 DUF3304 domain-containing protein [Duganella vulcania]